MGVSGSGKTTIGRSIAAWLELPFFDADDFHSEVNITKMKAGIPLNDEDRKPWLIDLSQNLSNWEKSEGAVLACSALKEGYREILTSEVSNIYWIVLDGLSQLIRKRMQERKGHYMDAEMLQSQYDALEIPDYGLHLDIKNSPEQLLHEIKTWYSHQGLSQIGIIGLGVMGKNLALNAIDSGFRVSVYNRTDQQEAQLLNSFMSDYGNDNVHGFSDFEGFVNSLKTPRLILIMIKSGDAIDQVIQNIKPFLSTEDILVDGGNSFFEDTMRRQRSMKEKDIHFIGMGISGGAEGALNGPSMMPGGNKEAYEQIYPLFAQMAAVDKNNSPCVGYIGPGGSGHYVKMVHNGIEYAEMQLLAEVFGLLSVELSYEQIATIFETWCSTSLNSFLLQISTKILRKKDKNKRYVIDSILDVAGSKGTGNWTSRQALELGSVNGMIASAVEFRMISQFSDMRIKYAERIKRSRIDQGSIEIEQLRKGYSAARIINHHQGFELLRLASIEFDWDLDLSELSRIWTAGCIIRSVLMQDLVNLFGREQSLLDDESYFSTTEESEKALIHSINSGIERRIAMPCFSSALNYWFAITSRALPTNLIQAQRDYFGNHGYSRRDSSADELFYTNWE